MIPITCVISLKGVLTLAHMSFASRTARRADLKGQGRRNMFHGIDRPASSWQLNARVFDGAMESD